MTPREILLKMLEWIAEEQKKAAQVGGEPFIYLSLRYCASQVGAGERTDEVVRLLQKTVSEEPPHMQFDAVRPFRAIFLVNRTLDKLA